MPQRCGSPKSLLQGGFNQERCNEQEDGCVSAVPASRGPHACGGQSPCGPGTTGIMLSALEFVYSVPRVPREGGCDRPTLSAFTPSSWNSPPAPPPISSPPVLCKPWL